MIEMTETDDEPMYWGGTDRPNDDEDDRIITEIPQVDGGRRIRAQDARHARRAREILRRDSSMIDHLDGMDGIRITTQDVD